jgi:hypothetical protein
VSSALLRFINELPPDTIWVTQQVLHLDTRNHIDKCHSRLAKTGEIVRLAIGVYYKPDPKNPRRVLDDEIAAAKGMAFGKPIIQHPNHFTPPPLRKTGKEDEQELNHRWYQVDGPSSQFRTINGTIVHFHGASKRKMRLGDSKAGKTLRALWHDGQTNSQQKLVNLALQDFSQPELFIVGRMAARIPVWLAERLVPMREKHRSEIFRRWQINALKRHHTEKLDKTPFASNLCRGRDSKRFSHW